MFDTHCHLNFKVFDGRVDRVIERAKNVGVSHFLVPGTDVVSSKKAVELAKKSENIYAAVGIHPHHIYQYQVMGGGLKSKNYILKLKGDLEEIEKMLTSLKVVAVGEVGIDKYYYRDTKYSKYVINPEFITLQKAAFLEQIKLAIKYKKSLIVHTREAAGESLAIIGEILPDPRLNNRVVFHCCEANYQLLQFALAHHVYIGVDGDVTYSKKKQEFIKEVPLDVLVLETDSPFLLPRRSSTIGGTKAGLLEPLKYPNEPKNLLIIAQFIANLKKTSTKHLIEETSKNARRLFDI